MSSQTNGDGLKLGPLLLSPGTRKGHVATYYWLALTSIMTFTFIPGAQAALLSAVLGIAEEDQGRLTGLLGVVGEVVLITVVAVSGAVSDRVGRRPIAVAGYTVMGVGVGLTPFVGSEISLLTARAISGVGIAMVSGMITTVIADYVRDETRGKANGLLGFANGLGAIITFFVLVQLPETFEAGGMTEVAAIRATYLIVASLALATALVMRVGLRGGVAVVAVRRPPIHELLRVGLVAGKRPGLTLSYATAFIARADLALVGAFLILWVTQYGESTLGLSSTEALARAGVLVGVANGTALLAAPVIGILADRWSRVDAVLVALAVASVGYGATIFVEDPSSGLGFAVAAVMGAGQTSTVIASQVLVAEQSPPSIRGSVIGMFGLFGGIGIMIALGLGGVLFDVWRPAAPFVMFSALAAVVLVYGLSVRGRIPREEATD